MLLEKLLRLLSPFGNKLSKGESNRSSFSSSKNSKQSINSFLEEFHSDIQNSQLSKEDEDELFEQLLKNTIAAESNDDNSYESQDDYKKQDGKIPETRFTSLGAKVDLFTDPDGFESSKLMTKEYKPKLVINDHYLEEIKLYTIRNSKSYNDLLQKKYK